MNWNELTEEEKALLERMAQQMKKQQGGETDKARNREWRSGIQDKMLALAGDTGRAYRLTTALYTIVNWKLKTRNIMKLNHEEMEKADGIIGRLFEILEAKIA